MSDTVNWVEVIYSTVMLVGLARSSGRWWRYYNLYCGTRDEGLQLVYFMRAQNQAFLAVVFELYGGVGLISMMLPDPPGYELTLENLVLSVMFVIGGCLLVLKGEAADRNLERLSKLPIIAVPSQ